MSYSSVCQGLQSSVELETRVLKLKLAPPGSNHSRTSEWPSSNNNTSSFSSSDSDTNIEKPLTKPTTNNDHMNKTSQPGGCNWNFLQSLSKISHCNKAENVYVHPSTKCSSLKLSPRSLELCTESLGCETGSNASDSTEDVSLFSFESSYNLRMNNNLSVNKNSKSKRLNKGSNFPPPLTSMREVQVRSHREDGRLILEAVTSSSPQPYFVAERSNGRLRLRLFENVASYYGDEEEEEEEEEVETLNQEPCGEEDGLVEEELEECAGYGEDEKGMTNFVRPSRCKDSGNRVIFGDGYFELRPVSLCL